MSDFFQQLYDRYTAKIPSVPAYLERIGVRREDVALTKQGLDMVQFAHLCSVPFENLDIFDYDRFIDFGIEDVFEKIVTQRRGGYCFELNASFMELLKALGFEVYPVGVRVLLGGGTTMLRPISHRATIVTIEGKRYYTDVGFGTAYGPGASLDIDEMAEQQFLSEKYTVKDRPYNTKEIIRTTHEHPEALFSFKTDPFNILDFVSFNTTVQEKAFRDKRMVNLRRPDGSMSFDGDMFRVFRDGKCTQTPLSTGKEAFDVLNNEFGMKLTMPLKESAFAINP